MKKTVVRAALAAWILSCMFAMTAAASAAIRETEYAGNGRVEAEFTSDVRYRSAKITVRDPEGRKVPAVILDKDEDDLAFALISWQQGKTYTFTISGIKKPGEKNYGSVRGKIRIPVSKGPVPVSRVNYDREDHKLKFEFESLVGWKKPTVSITRGKKQYAVKILEKAGIEMRVRVKNLQKGKVYRYRITGVSSLGEKAFSTVTGDFTA